jgi:NAD(P)H-hydrate epimerase
VPLGGARQLQTTGGICAARHLANRDIDVKLCLSAPDRLGHVAAFQRKVFASTSGTEVGIADIARQAPDLIVDALIGYGLHSAPEGPVAGLIRRGNATALLNAEIAPGSLAIRL